MLGWNSVRQTNVQLCENRSDLGHMNDDDYELFIAMLAIAFAAVTLVAGQQYIEHRSTNLPTISSAVQVALGEACPP